MTYLQYIPITLLAFQFIKPITTLPTVNTTKCGLMEDTRKQGFQMPIMDAQVLQECPDKLSDCRTVGKPSAQSNCRECCLKLFQQTQTSVGKY